MAMYQQDPIARGQINSLEHALGESEQKRFVLERKVTELNGQIEKLTGFGPEYVRQITEQFSSQLRDSRRSLVDAKRQHGLELEKLEAQIRRELDRYVHAKRMADDASGKLRV